MKSKLHFGILIVLFVVLGRYMETAVSPNQQIVVQFSNTEANVTEIDVKKVIETIQFKLHQIGAEAFRIGQNKDGNLTISYYSATDVKNIESILSKDQSFKLAFGLHHDSNKTPEDETSKEYKLNVSEIQKKNQNTDWDFDGVQVVEHNQKTDRLNHLKKHTSGHKNQSQLTNTRVMVALLSYENLLAVDDKDAHKIPEVRAGPCA